MSWMIFFAADFEIPPFVKDIHHWILTTPTSPIIIGLGVVILIAIYTSIARSRRSRRAEIFQDAADFLGVDLAKESEAQFREQPKLLGMLGGRQMEAEVTWKNLGRDRFKPILRIKMQHKGNINKLIKIQFNPIDTPKFKKIILGNKDVNERELLDSKFVSPEFFNKIKNYLESYHTRYSAKPSELVLDLGEIQYEKDIDAIRSPEDLINTVQGLDGLMRELETEKEEKER